MLKLIKTLAVASLLSASPSLCAAAEQQEPMMTFRSSLTNQEGTANIFTFYISATEDTYIDVDCGFGPFEVEVGASYFDEDTGEIEATPVTCTLSPEGTVKVYGDPSIIDYISLNGCYVTDIEWPRMTELQILNVDHNLFNSLDLSHMTKLRALYANDIPCTQATPFIVGANKPELQILHIAMVEWLDPAFDIACYPELRSFVAYSTPTLTRLDPTNCPKLLQLSLDATNVSSLDVTKNPYLLILNVSETPIQSLDVSKNTYLTELYAQHRSDKFGQYKISSIDVTNNPELQRFYIGGNMLTELDLSKNTKLVSFSCRINHIKALDFTGLDNLELVDVAYNNMDFNTCPLPSTQYSSYEYAQYPMQVDRSYKVGTVLDFTDRVIRPDSETDAVLYGKNSSTGELEILSDEYYSYADGKFTLNKVTTDSVYAAFKNPLFPDWTLTTSSFVVKSEADFGKPVPMVTLTTLSSATTQNYYIGFAGASEEHPVTFYVQFGSNAELLEFQATSESIPTTPNVTGTRVNATTTIYAPEGGDITAFKTEGFRIIASNFTSARTLRELVINNCNMSSINLTYNNLLTKLDLSHNNFTKIDLSGANSSFFKMHLKDLNLSYNKLTSAAYISGGGMVNVDLSNNAITEYDLDESRVLCNLNLANNAITELNLADCDALEWLDVSGNALTELTVYDTNPLKYLNVANNSLTYATLPAPGVCAEYYYAPQADVMIPTKAPSINLSEQYVTINGHTTQFQWYRLSDNSPVTEGIRENEGRFGFTDPNIGEIYCCMTNAAYPALSGDDVLKTTVVETADVPTNAFVTFVTTQDGEASITLTGKTKGSTIYIDWTGNKDYEQYVLDTSYINFPVETFAGATVKCYSYEEEDGVTVFSIFGAKISSIDASKMKSVMAFGLYNTGTAWENIILPPTDNLEELLMPGNGFTNVSLDNCPKLRHLVLNNNNLTTFDATKLPALQTLYLSGNSLEEVKLDNPHIWELSLMNNNLESIDLSGVPDMQQLWLTHNKLSSIDLSPMAGLRVVAIDQNYFTFTTLPLPQSTYTLYSYGNQAPVEVEVIDGCMVDLSSQAMVGDVATEYTWYIDTPYYDDYGDLVGEDLYEGEEYTLENGVTTFLKPFHNIMCVMTNTVFPSIYLYTNFIDVTAGVEDVTVDETGMTVTVNDNVVTVKCDVADGTPVALLGIDGRVIARSAINGGIATLTAPRGHAIITVGARAAKVLIK